MTQNPADVVFLGGNILTTSSPADDVTALAVKDGLVVACGSDALIWSMAGPDTQVVELHGRTVLPGMTDCHCHLEMAAIGLSLLTDVHAPPYMDISALQDALLDACQAKPEGSWVVGQGNLFHDLRLRERRYPTRAELDAVSRTHRIAVRLGAHVTVLNSLALADALERGALDVGSTLVLKDESGSPSGICMDVWEAVGVPDPSEDEVRRALVEVGTEYFLARGVTAIGNVTESLAGQRLINQTVLSGQLPLRIGNYFRIPRTYSRDDFAAAWPSLARDSDQLLWAAGVKLFADGGLSAREAATHAPHPGTDHRGHMFYTPAELGSLLAELSALQVQVMTHCAGDRAADTVIDAYVTEFERSGCDGLRWRIEHVGNPYATDERLEAIRDAGILGVPNPTHLYSIGDHFAGLVGEERAQRTSMRLRTMMDAGMLCPGNSDLTSSQPESSNPFVGVAAAVTRRTYQGIVINPHEAITVREALRMYTQDSATAMHAEGWRGSLEVGKVADLVVLDRDVLAVPDHELQDTAVLETYVSGTRVYSRRETA